MGFRYMCTTGRQVRDLIRRYVNDRRKWEGTDLMQDA